MGVRSNVLGTGTNTACFVCSRKSMKSLWLEWSDGGAEISRRKVRKVPSLLRQGLEEPSRDSCLYSVEREKLLGAK